jgi:cell division septal protein FtsQ
VKTARRRRKKSPAARLRPFWILIVLMLALATAAGYLFVTWPGLFPQSIVVTGERVVSRGEILAKAQIEMHRNLWLQSPRAMEARIERIPYIATAAVHRIPTANVAIEVTERTPFAILTSGGASVLVDHDLRVLQPDDGTQALPRIVVGKTIALTPGTFVRDSDARELRDDDDTLVAGHVVPATLSQDKYGELVVTMHNGIRILLGDDDDLQKKVRMIDPILSQLGRSSRPIAAIDLRAPNTPVVVYKTPVK